MMKLSLALAVATLGLVVPPAKAAGAEDIIQLKRRGAWVADFGESYCRLAANFGEADNQIYFEVSKSSPGDQYQLLMAGLPLKFEQQFQTKPVSAISLAFGAGELIEAKNFELGTLGANPMIQINDWRLDNFVTGKVDERLPVITVEQETAVRTLSFRKENKTFQLQLGSMAAPMRTLRTCFNSLLESWGVDANNQATLKQGVIVRSNQSNWVSDLDYPSDALFLKKQGMVSYILSVSDSGDVVDCQTRQEKNINGLGKLTCNLLRKRAKFYPALDDTGKAAPSYYMGKVRWAVPEF